MNFQENLMIMTSQVGKNALFYELRNLRTSPISPLTLSEPGGVKITPPRHFLSRFRYDCDSLFKFLHKKLLRITQLLKKNLGRYHHYRGYYDVIISKSLKFRVSDFSGVIRFFAFFAILDLFIGRNRKNEPTVLETLGNYLLKSQISARYPEK